MVIKVFIFFMFFATFMFFSFFMVFMVFSIRKNDRVLTLCVGQGEGSTYKRRTDKTSITIIFKKLFRKFQYFRTP